MSTSADDRSPASDELPRGAREVTAAGALARHAHDGSTMLVSLTDEELLFLVGTDNSAELRLPWIEQMEQRPEGYRREDGLQSASRSLLARGWVGAEVAIAQAEQREPQGDPSGLTANALLTGVVSRRRLSGVVLELDSLTRPENGKVLLFVDQDGTVLHEQVLRSGIHSFLMENLETAKTRLSERVDPDGRAAEDGTAVRGSWEEILADPSIGETIRTATDQSSLRTIDRTAESERALWIFSGPAGTVAMQVEPDSESTDLEDASLAAIPVGTATLQSLLAWMLEVTPPEQTAGAGSAETDSDGGGPSAD